MAAGLLLAPPASSSPSPSIQRSSTLLQISSSSPFLSGYPPASSSPVLFPSAASLRRTGGGFSVSCCLPLTPKSGAPPSTKLYVSGLSFRTTEESLRNAFQNFGQLVEVNLVMDRIANRPRGFAFLRYATEVESQKAIEGMHGKFLDGRVIFVEVAKPRSEVRQASRPNLRRY